MSKTTLFNDNARRALEKGMNILSEAVSITLGPKDRNVVLQKEFDSPQIIKNGVKIAKGIELKTFIENTGVSFI